MNFIILYHYYSYICSSLGNLFLALSLIFGLAYFFWKFATDIYEVATTVSGIHYVEHPRRHIKINASFLNPFYIQVDFKTANFSGINCILKCDGVCYVQALWSVPIYSLVQYLNKDYSELLKSVTSYELSKNLSSECAHASKPFVLADNIEKSIEFQLPSHVKKAMLFSGAVHSRTIYPFVVLMIMTERSDPLKYPHPYVIASANAIHLPDHILNKSEFIAQFLRLSSGYVGQMKKIYRSSPIQDKMTDLCLICYQKPVSVVQLSCRHFCLCRSCYEKCDKCPLCRNAHMDFFELPFYSDADVFTDQFSRSEEDIEEEVEE